MRAVHRGTFVVAPCAPHRDANMKNAQHYACHIEQMRREIGAKTVLCFGTAAQEVVLGDTYHPVSARRGYHDLEGYRAHVMLDALDGANTLYRDWMKADIAHALGTSPGFFQPTPYDVALEVIESRDDAEYALNAIYEADESLTAFDAETIGRLFTRNFRACSWAVAFTVNGQERVFVWDRGLDGPTPDDAFDVLRDYFTHPQILKCGQNVKYDILVARQSAGVDVEGVVADVRLWRKILQPDAAADLDLMSGLVGMYGAKAQMEKALVTVRKEAKKATKAGKRLPGMTDEDARLVDDKHVGFRSWAYGFVPASLRQIYVARDAVATLRLKRLFEHPTTPNRDRMLRVWNGTLGKAAAALVNVETRGMPVDRNAIKELDALLDLRLRDLVQQFSEYPGLDPASNASVSEFLFEKCRLKVEKRTPTGAPSVDEEALDRLSGKHPVVALILEYRGLAKLKGTYAEGLIRELRDDGRIHSSIKPDGAETGRWSSSDPNLQNIPRAGSELGRMIRDCFVAPPGWSFMECDYNQLELRVAAMLSNDPIMSAVFIADEDFHKRTAQLIAPVAWHTQPEDVTDEHRSQAKAANFGGMYGQGPAALAKKLGISKDLATRIQTAILGKFKGYAEWKKRTTAKARATGATETWWNGEAYRSRPLPGLFSPDDMLVSRATNGATNTPIQGTGSEFCIASVGEVEEWIRDDFVPAELIMAIHDSLLLLVKDSAIQECAYHIPRIMCSFNSGKVPLRVDVKVGKTWGTMKKLEGKITLPQRKDR
jgi:DNA polymerase I-like protein with 3'-5' exonuclease and polymerase domains